MYRFFFLLFVLTVIAPAFSQSTVVTMNPFYSDNYYRPYYSQAMYNNRYNSFYQSKLNPIEKYTFGRTYPYESYQNRIRRLERQAFGEEQYDSDYQRRYENAKSAILGRPVNSENKSVKSRWNNYFNGQVTGFTPQITPRMLMID